MNSKFTRFLFLLIVPVFVYSQNTLIESIDFESPNFSIQLNSDTVGTNSGFNKWIINNQYSGGGVMPNTISQDSTFGGVISFPNGSYLHIHDSATAALTGVANTNYAPLNTSDRFTLLGDFCTLGFSNVVLAFYYMGLGDSANAYAEILYSANGAPWQSANNVEYRNRYKWKYEEISNAGFDNLSSLRFGVRWRNNANTNTNPISFGMDDIRIVGDFDANLVGMSIDFVSPQQVCQGTNLLLFYTFSAPLCGSSFYQFELSNASGNFNNATDLGIFQLSNLNTSGAVFLPIPGNIPPGTCYQIRFSNLDYSPVIYSDTSLCFEVQQCANTITTLQPVVLSNPSDTICVGSVIDVPFYSTGIFVNNTYVAQLSDSAGNFPVNPNVLGTFPNSDTYDPNLGSPPGSVSGLIAPLFHPIPAGCNYYIRVVSVNPTAIGTVYGPFCIRNCDIETNQKQDIQACINDLVGFDTLLTVNINMFDSAAVYDPLNQFEIQVLSSQTFGIISTGLLGTVVAQTDTTVQLSVPILPLLNTVGLSPGMVYLRIISTASSTNWNQLGTLVRLTIGAPNPAGLLISAYNPNNFTGYVFNIDSSICVGDGIFFTLSPFNFTSTYQWALNNDPNWSTQSSTGILFNGAGDLELSVKETNFGCIGPGSDTARISVTGPPSVAVTGPSQVCIGDTANYSVPLQPNSYYSWGSSNSSVFIDTLNNELNLFFPNSGLTVINIQALNQCGTATANKNVQVRPLPIAFAGTDTTICPNTNVVLKATKNTGYNFQWVENGTVVSTTDSVSFVPTDTTTLFLTVTTYPSINGGCKSFDTLTVNLKPAGPSSSSDSLICQDSTINLKALQTGNAYVWSSGDSTNAIAVSAAGTYYVMTLLNTSCPAMDTFNITTYVCEKPVEDSISIPNVFTPNGDNLNNLFQVSSANIENFKMDIYDRWGLLLATLTSATEGWNGETKNAGKCTDGTYFWVLSFNYFNKANEKRSGYVTLLR